PTCTQQCHPSVLPSSATHQCPAVLPSVPPISAAYQCSIISASSSVLLINVAYQCPSVMPINAAYPCHLISAHQCCLSVPISAASSTHIN
ncbi:unnamed protein product, partial [Staurois parvus]